MQLGIAFEVNYHVISEACCLSSEKSLDPTLIDYNMVWALPQVLGEKKMKKIFVMAAIVAVMLAGRANADLVAYWNQNSNDLPGGGFGFQPGDFPQAADQGAGTINFGGGILNETTVNNNGDTVLRWIPSFAGTTQNALEGDPAGGSLGIQGGTDAQNNGGFFEFSFDMTNFFNLEVSYATQRTGTGFSSQTWSYSTDGQNFTNHQVISDIPTSFGVVNLNTITALDGVSTAFLRVTFDGATAQTGNNRLDNIQFNASVIPEPSAAILFTGLIGWVGLQRRRRS